MKRKILGHFSLLVLGTLLLSFALAFAVLYGSFSTQMRSEIRREAGLIAAGVQGQGLDYFTSLPPYSQGGRVTYISPEGKVLFDSVGDERQMENHLDRPEISDALHHGAGEASRLSSTIGYETYYYALKLPDGSVVRTSSTVRTAYAQALSLLPMLLLCALAAFALSLFAATHQTAAIVKPINELNLEHPDADTVYEELSPLLRRIQTQKEEIARRVSQLEAERREFEAITENMNEGLILLDGGADILTMNRAASLIFSLPRDRKGSHILSVNRSPELESSVNSALKGLSALVRFSLDGKIYQLAANPVFAGEEVQGAVLFLLDVTGEARAESLRREFTANVSHELKTPLTAISGYAEIMENGLARPEDMRQFAGRIYRESQRLIRLVEDILYLSRLDEGKAPEPEKPVDLYALAGEVLARLKPQAAEKGVSLRLEGNPQRVWGAASILDEILQNLCDNAIKYNVPSGSVTVTVEGRGGGTALMVEDTGIGIPKEHQERVFERFYRVDKSHSRESGGTGLGLSIVKHGALYHGASLSLSSEPGKGTRVEIFFPSRAGQ